MVRRAQRANPRKAQVSIGVEYPPPTGGWNARDSLAAMAQTDAVILDNWVPRPGLVELRRGWVQTVSGFGSPVETLIPFRGGGAGTDMLFAASGGAIYNGLVSPLGAALMSGFTSNRWNYTPFANSAGAWTIAVNGSDTPIGYNAGAWGALPTLSGSSGPITLTPSTLFNVFSHKGRLFYLQKNSLYVWNPAAGAVGGACTLLDLSSVFNKGGSLICGATWSYQFGVTMDDFAVFMTDQGQVAVYQGIDPTNASAWSLVGVYDLGPPLGPRAMLKFGGDLAIVTTDGVIPLSQASKLERSQADEVALTSKIVNAFSAAVRAYQGNYGWCALFYPGAAASNLPSALGGSLAIFNIPVSTLGTSMQFVQNVLTGAWCRWPSGINSFCWEIANGNAYFGTTAAVCQWDQGASDNGQPIVGTVLGAFSSFGQPARIKSFKGVRPLLNASPLVAPALDVNVNFKQTVPTAVPTVIGQGATAAAISFNWTGCSGVGVYGAPIMQVNLKGDATVAQLGVGDIGQDLVGVDGAGDTLLTSANLPFDVPCQLLGFNLLYEPGAFIG